MARECTIYCDGCRRDTSKDCRTITFWNGKYSSKLSDSDFCQDCYNAILRFTKELNKS